MKRSTVIYKSAPDEGIKEGLINLLTYLFSMRYIFYVLLKGNIKKRYKGSYLGVLWALLNPIISMLGMAIIFPLIVKFKMENYLIYLFSGILIWGFISSATVSGGDAILGNQSLARKIYIPKIIFPYVVVSSEAINLLIATFAFHLIALAFGLHIETNLTYLCCAIVVSYMFGLGVASITSVVIVYYRDIKYIMGVIMQSLFFVSAIIFPVSVIPEKYVHYLEMNPFYHYVRLFHEAIYSGASADWRYFIPPVLISIFLMFSLSTSESATTVPSEAIKVTRTQICCFVRCAG